jgi:hypothetical protein
MLTPHSRSVTVIAAYQQTNPFPVKVAQQLLKAIIFVLLIGVIASLGSGLIFLFKDTDKSESRRTLHALGVRIVLAVALLGTIFYGIYSGQLTMGANAPWHGQTQQSD